MLPAVCARIQSRSVKCDIFWFLVWIVAGTRLGFILELSDRKTRDFIVQIAFLRWFSERAHQLFGEITVRT
jgi:hypothetical protein